MFVYKGITAGVAGKKAGAGDQCFSGLEAHVSTTDVRVV